MPTLINKLSGSPAHWKKYIQRDAGPTQNNALHRFWAAAFYFLAFSAIAALFPFLTLFYKDLGFSGSQIGMLTAISPLVTLFAAPLWAGLADATRRHRALLTIANAGAIGVIIILSHTTTLTGVTLAIGGFAFITAPIMSLVDNGTMFMLGDQKERYGRLRLWGTVGWAITAPIVGQLIESDGLRWAFYGYVVTLAFGLLVGQWLSLTPDKISIPFWRGMRTLFNDRRWGLFLAMAFIGGMGFAVVNNYLFLYLEQMGASKTLMGLSLTISTLSEIPVMIFTDRLLRRFTARGLLIISLAIFSVRILLFSVVDVPWLVLLIQLMHGPTFPMLWVAGVSHADEIAPPGLGATAQGVFSGTLMGLGAAAGGLLGGVLFTDLGPWRMYRTFGLVVLVSVLGFTLLERRIRAKRS